MSTKTTTITSSPLPDFGVPAYGITKKLEKKSFDQAIASVQEELKKVGFGIITQIDMRNTMREKLNTELERPYVILGACNPRLAHEALTHQPAVGLLLPCNIVVTQDSDGKAVVSALRPVSLFGATANDITTTSSNQNDMVQLAQKIETLLQSVIDAL
jgi:uncharacterized protein (DUF302 family)